MRATKLVLSILSSLFLTASVVTAQVKSPRVGDRVDYPNLGQGWEQGTIVEVDSNNLMVKVHRVNGMDQWFGDGAVRPATASTRAVPTPPMTGTGLVTKDEVLSYVTSYGQLNGHYTGSPEVCQAVSLAIKARGAQFRYSYSEMAPVASAGCVAGSWPIPTAVALNYGTPKQLGWLMGKWNLSVIAPTLDRAAPDGWIYRKEEFGVKAGFVKINADHSYVWQMFPQDPPSQEIKGTWRLATDSEMGLQGGAGIVLTRGESASDWIVFPWSGATTKEIIEIENLQYRSQRRLGARQ